jgi:hypothetical protein
MILFPNRTIAHRDDVAERVKEEFRKPGGAGRPGGPADDGLQDSSPVGPLPSVEVRGRLQEPVAEEGRFPPCAQQAEETLVPDPRNGLTPADLVERKVVAMLGGAPLPVSQIYRNRFSGRPRVNSRPRNV